MFISYSARRLLECICFINTPVHFRCLCRRPTHTALPKNDNGRFKTKDSISNFNISLLPGIIIITINPIKAETQSCSQPHSPGWARAPLSYFFPQISINFSYFSSNLFSSSFWSSGWATRPPGKALATPLPKPPITTQVQTTKITQNTL